MSTSPGSTQDSLPLNTKLQGGAFIAGKVIGQGGFGISYYGGDMKLRRYVAIKEFFPAGNCVRYGNDVQPTGGMTATDFTNAKAQFLNEARILAQFRHPGIVNVYTFFEENNTAYMVMEYLKGKTLQDLIDEKGILPEAEAIRYIERVGEALELVHQVNFLHRDIKPANIMLCDDGLVVLIDFGLTKEIENTVDLHTRQLVATTRFGTSGYAPPEQYVKHSQEGPFTDIYALAATLYHLLTGEAPVAAMERMYGVELPTVHHLQPQMSRTVSDAVMGAMDIKEDKRPQTVREFLSALRDAVKPVSASVPAQLPSPSSTPVPVHPSARASTFDVHDAKSFVMAVRNAPPHAVIRLKAGDYRLTTALSPLIIRKSLHIEGAGRVGDPPMDSTRILSSAKDFVMRFEGSCEWTIEGIAFEHLGAKAANVVEVSGGIIQMHRCSFTGGALDLAKGNGGGGLLLSGDAEGSVTECEAIGNGFFGIALTDWARVVLDGNYCHENTSSGSMLSQLTAGVMYFHNAAGVARNNECVGNSLGISVLGQASPFLESNRCLRSKGSGISYMSSTEGLIRNNDCIQNQCGISIGFEATPTLQGNRCHENESNGIEYLGQSAGTANNNKCMRNKQNGIAVRDQAQPVIQSNQCLENVNNGIIYSGHAIGIAQKNECIKNQNMGIAVSDDAKPIVENSVCRENTHCGIAYLGSSRGLARGNASHRNGNGIAIAEHARPHLQNNRCRENEMCGIYYRDEAGGTAQNNECTGNSYGIVVNSTAKVRLMENHCTKNKELDIMDER